MNSFKQLKATLGLVVDVTKPPSAAAAAAGSAWVGANAREKLFVGSAELTSWGVQRRGVPGHPVLWINVGAFSPSCDHVADAEFLSDLPQIKRRRNRGR